MPATISKIMILAQLCVGSRSMKSPKPRHINVSPNQIGGRYLPVFLMNTPVAPETKESERARGRR